MGKIKLYAKGTALAGALLVFAGCGKGNQVIDSSDTTSVSDTTDDSISTTTYADTSVLESDGTVAYYVTDWVGETTSIGSINDITTSKSTIGDTTSKVSGTTTSTSKVVGTTTRTTTQAPRVTTARTTSATNNTTTTPKVTTTITTQQGSPNYTLGDIRNDANAFKNYANLLRGEVINKSLTLIEMPYGTTTGSYEFYLMLAILNDEYINDNVLSEVFSDLSEEQVKNSVQFLYNLGWVQSNFGTRVDFTKYTLDKDIGKYLNVVEQACIDNTYDNYFSDQFLNNNIEDKYLNSLAVASFTCGYDINKKYFDSTDVDDFHMNFYINHLFEVCYGHSYTK